jgi:hypothetical protein
VVEELQRRTQSIRKFPVGTHTPHQEPRLLRELTDELLVTSSDAASRVGAEPPALQANPIYRLLAWLVADACGAATPMDSALALTVGKRLDRRALTVRAQLAAAYCVRCVHPVARQLCTSF